MDSLEKAATPKYSELVALTQEQDEKLGDIVGKLEAIRVQHQESAALNAMWRDRYLDELLARKKQRALSWLFMLTTPIIGISVAMMDSSNPIKTSLIVIFEYLKGVL